MACTKSLGVFHEDAIYLADYNPMPLMPLSILPHKLNNVSDLLEF